MGHFRGQTCKAGLSSVQQAPENYHSAHQSSAYLSSPALIVKRTDTLRVSVPFTGETPSRDRRHRREAQGDWHRVRLRDKMSLNHLPSQAAHKGDIPAMRTALHSMNVPVVLRAFPEPRERVLTDLCYH